MITKKSIRRKLDEALAVALEERCSELSDNLLEAVDIHQTEHHIDKMVHHGIQAEKHGQAAMMAGSRADAKKHEKQQHHHEQEHLKHKAIVQQHHDNLVKQIAALKRAK